MVYPKTRITLATLSVLSVILVDEFTLVPIVLTTIYGTIGFILAIVILKALDEDELKDPHDWLESNFGHIGFNIRMRFQRADKEW